MLAACAEESTRHAEGREPGGVPAGAEDEPDRPRDGLGCPARAGMNRVDVDCMNRLAPRMNRARCMNRAQRLFLPQDLASRVTQDLASRVTPRA